MSVRPAWPPSRPTMTRGERIAGLVGLGLVVVLYLFRLGAGSPLLAPDDEQCEKWPTYRTEQCYEMIPLDEVHYVPDARDVLLFGTESDIRVPTPDDGAFVVHPPVGKWFIAAGIAIAGDNPFGWRLFNALLGVFGVFLCFSLARRLLGSTRWAMLAAGILALDGLWFTMSRIAMLDIPAGVGTLAGLRLTIEVVARAVERRPRRGLRVWTGIVWGLALATKWSVAPFALVAGILLIGAEAWAWLVRSRPAAVIDDTPVEVEVFGRDAIEAWADALVATRPRPDPQASGRGVAATAVSIGVLPFVVYVAAFAPWLVNSDRYVPPRCEGRAAITGWWCYQIEQLDFHRNLEKYELVEHDDDDDHEEEDDGHGHGAPAEEVDVYGPAHPYFANASTWAWVGRPVVHAYTTESIDDVERAREVMSVPNPIGWWFAFFIALPWLVVRAVRDRSALLVLALLATGWGPYLVADLVARPVFLFYATPLVPILAIASAMLLKRLWEGPAGGVPSASARGVAIGVITAIVLAFAWLYPIHSGAPLPMDRFGWSARIWFTTDCSAETIKVLCWI